MGRDINEWIEALRELFQKADQGSGFASERLQAVEHYLFAETFHEREFRRFMKTKPFKELPQNVQNGLELYFKMSQLAKLCEPDGRGTGPSCPIRLIPFDRLAVHQLLDFKNTFTMTMFGLSKNASIGGSALALLSLEDQKLYGKLVKDYGPGRGYFGGKKKPTLKSLAAQLLSEEGRKGFSYANTVRLLKAIGRHQFPISRSWTSRVRQGYMVRRVNDFGKDRRTGRQHVAELETHLMRAAATAWISMETDLQNSMREQAARELANMGLLRLEGDGGPQHASRSNLKLVH